ncbi:MAG: hypothetical protein M1484_02190 [Patescibacteria group bacterium]|nr:hypothetical protein [Patescibacteria group bacterium]
MGKEEGLLTEKEVRHPGCGMGTENACFALSRNVDGWVCLLLANPNMAQMAGIKLGWRVNVDSIDEKAWCPKGVLDNSKKPEE